MQGEVQPRLLDRDVAGPRTCLHSTPFLVSRACGQCADGELRSAVCGDPPLATPRKVTEQKRGGAELTVEDTQTLEFGIHRGRSAVWLKFTPEQYGKRR